MRWNTTNGTQYCNETELHIELAQNDTGKATGAGQGTVTHNGDTHCEVVQLGAKILTVTGVSIPHIQLDGEGTGTLTFTYVYDLPGPTKCHFEGTAGITYTSGTSSIKIAGSMTGKKIEGAGACSTTGSILGDFAVSDEFGGAAVVH